MIELCFKSTKLRFDFSFFAVLAVFSLCERLDTGIAALCACAAHELSHVIVMRYFGVQVGSVTFYCAGIKISSDDTENAPARVQLAVYLAGSGMNFLLAIAFGVLGYPYLAAINLLTGLFNLLPLGEFDGAKLLRLAAFRFAKPERIDLWLRLGNIASLAVVLLLCLFFGSFSFTLAVTLAYIAAVVLLRA